MLPVLLAVGIAIVLLGAAVLVPVLLNRDDDGSASAGSPTTEGADSQITDSGDLADVEVFEDLTFQHVAPGEDVDYPQAPAVGGDHAPVWLECGVYDEPLPEANVVHDLEHGTVWITYREDLLDPEEIADLAEQLPDNGIMSPYPDQDAPAVITVWGRQLSLVGPEDSRIALFIAEYGAGETAPEPYASCHGGVDPDDLATGGGTVV